jgi:hypothetical protein
MRRTPWVIAAVTLAALLLPTGTAEAAKSITVPDTGTDIGQHTSVAMTDLGDERVSYYDVTNGDLKVALCDGICTSGGGAASTVSPDTAGDVGQYTSLVLTGSYKYDIVVSYYDVTNKDLKVMKCYGSSCSPVSIMSPDTGGDVGQYTSLAVDGSGYPVVSYYDVTNGDLKVMHCNDPQCDSAVNGAESITSPDMGGDVGQYTSLALDGNGYPVVSYYDVTNHDLKVMHCNDVNCAGYDESITSPDTGNRVGAYTSLALLGSNPVVSYYDISNNDLKVMHCNDANCAGGDESITSPDTDGAVGAYTSLDLDHTGSPTVPVVSYYDIDHGNLKVLHCGNMDCTSGNTKRDVDTLGDVGQYTSLLVWQPVGDDAFVSYYDATQKRLKTLYCSEATCSSPQYTGGPDLGGDDVGQYDSLVLDSHSYPVVSYWDKINRDLKVLHCNDPQCDSAVNGEESIASPDTTGDVGATSSLALDGSGNPVVSYYDVTNHDLKVLHCGNANCTAGNSITSPDTTGDVGWSTSMALDSSGNPVVAYCDSTNVDLKVMHCNDANCAGGGESITSPDTSACGGNSLVLDSSGYPVVSYAGLKVLHCNDPNCAGGDESITTPDAGTYSETSLALDGSGYPVVSYTDSTIGWRLKVMHCNDVNCAGGNESIVYPDPAPITCRYSSLALDSSGYPVVSYYDIEGSRQNLKLLHCDDANCAGDESSNIISPDTVGDVGQFTSLELDGSGYPVVSYYDNTDKVLKLLRCDTPTCATAAYPPAGMDELPVTLTFGHVYLCAEGGPDCVDAGAVTFDGTGKFSRGDPYVDVGTGLKTIDTEVLSMVLTADVYGGRDHVTIRVGTEQGLSHSYGKIREQTAGTLIPADTWFDLFFKVESTNSNYTNTQNCDFGKGAEPRHFKGVTMTVPSTYVEYDIASCQWEAGHGCVVGCAQGTFLAATEMTDGWDDQRYYCNEAGGRGTTLTLTVGGIAEWPGEAAGPDSVVDSGGSSTFNYVALCGALGAAGVALAVGAWIARRRWAR